MPKPANDNTPDLKHVLTGVGPSRNSLARRESLPRGNTTRNASAWTGPPRTTTGRFDCGREIIARSQRPTCFVRNLRGYSIVSVPRGRRFGRPGLLAVEQFQRQENRE